MSYTEKLIEIIKFLYEDPNGCPWTREQTHKSLAPYFIEETYEAVEAIDKDDKELCSELGDVLLQIALHAQIADSAGKFNFDDAAKSICDKLTRRYPTILGDEENTLKTPEDIDKKWEEIKAQERASKGLNENSSIFDDVPKAIPALLKAQKISKRATRLGADKYFNKSDIVAKLHEELEELKAEINRDTIDRENLIAELGDVLYVTAKLAQLYDIDAEDTLRIGNNRIENRYRYVEKKLKEEGKNFAEASKKDIAKYWIEAKEIYKH